MNILFIKHIFVGFMVSEIPGISVFGYFPLHKDHLVFIVFLQRLICIYNCNSKLFIKFHN